MAQINAITDNANSFVPVIDIAPYLAGTPEGKRRVAEQLGRACREVGFYASSVTASTPDWWTGTKPSHVNSSILSLDEKMKLHIGNVPGVGYAGRRRHRARLYPRPGRATRPQRNVPDRQSRRDERSVFSERSGARPRSGNRWPERPAALKALYTKYYLRMGALAADLMRLSALALNLPKITRRQNRSPHQPPLTCGFTPAKICAVARPAARRRAHGLRHRHDPQSPATPSAGCRSQTRRKLARCADHSGFVRDQPGRPDGALDQRSLAFNAASRRQSAGRSQRWTRRLSIVFFHHPNYDANVSCLPTCVEPEPRPAYSRSRSATTTA